MDDTIKLLINSNLPWSAALVILAIVLRPVLVTLVTGAVDARKAQVKALEERNQNEKEQTKVLGTVREALDDNTTLTRSMLNLLQPIAQIPGSMQEIGKQMTQRADARDDMVREYGRRLELIQGAMAGLPDAYLAKTSAHFDPQLAGIKTALDALERQLAARPDAITPELVRELKTELEKIARLVMARESAGEQREDRSKDVEQ